MVDAALAGRAQAVEIGAPDHARAGTHGHGLDDVAAAPHAAVTDHRCTVTKRIAHRRDQLDGWWRTVELASAVVEQDHAVDAFGHRGLGILHTLNALDQ